VIAQQTFRVLPNPTRTRRCPACRGQGHWQTKPTFDPQTWDDGDCARCDGTGQVEQVRLPTGEWL
jgi:hypothetical protein